MSETTKVLEGEESGWLDREYDALSPEDKKVVDRRVSFYRKLATDHNLGTELVSFIGDLVKSEMIEEIKGQISDKAAE